MQENISLHIPNSKIILHPGDKVKLGRFSDEFWIVGYGWYAYAGNRSVCGWYLTALENNVKIKPLQLTDLDDIYLLEYR